jgi:hypothetical protein
LYIGKKEQVSPYYLDGLIDDVKIYNYARTADEIRLDYNAGFAARFGPQSSCDDDPGSCMDYGLVGYWGFEESTGQTAYDASLYSNDGTLGGSTSAESSDPKWKSGIRPLSGGVSGGGALQFDGVDDYVDVSRDATLEPQEFTLEAWVYLTQTSAYNIIFAKDHTAHTGIFYSYHLRTTSDGMEFLWNDGSIYQVLDYSGGALPTYKWVHIVATYKSGAQAIYKNGNVMLTGNRSDTITYSDTNLLIGKARNFGAWMHGLIDEVRIYNRALSAAEIRYHYNRGGPVAHWKFDEGSGSTAYDSTNNNNDGTISGATWTTGKHGSALSFDGTND